MMSSNATVPSAALRASSGSVMPVLGSAVILNSNSSACRARPLRTLVTAEASMITSTGSYLLVNAAVDLACSGIVLSAPEKVVTYPFSAAPVTLYCVSAGRGGGLAVLERHGAGVRGAVAGLRKSLSTPTCQAIHSIIGYTGRFKKEASASGVKLAVKVNSLSAS